jgi:hypothetical protein
VDLSGVRESDLKSSAAKSRQETRNSDLTLITAWGLFHGQTDESLYKKRSKTEIVGRQTGRGGLSCSSSCRVFLTPPTPRSCTRRRSPFSLALNVPPLPTSREPPRPPSMSACWTRARARGRTRARGTRGGGAVMPPTDHRRWSMVGGQARFESREGRWVSCAHVREGSVQQRAFCSARARLPDMSGRPPECVHGLLEIKNTHRP